MRYFVVQLLIGIFAIPLLACTGDSLPTGSASSDTPNPTPETPVPSTGAIAVSVSTIGADADVNGYSVQLDGVAMTTVAPTGSVTLSKVSEGSHSVALSGVASNCSVTSDNPYTMTVTADATAQISFTVSCQSTTTLEFALTTSSVPGNGGVTSGEGVYLDGTSVAANATQHPGYLFDEWTENSATVSDRQDYVFEIVADRTLVAHFSVDPESGKWSPGGTYSDWYFPGVGYSSLEWTFIPVADPPASLTDEGLLHYYAYTFAVTSANVDRGGGYAGFQTNGIILGQYRGKVINYSIWGSNGGKSDGWINPANAESGGWQIMYPYIWEEGRSYRFELKEGPSGVDGEGKWWGLSITDVQAGTTQFVGEQRVPAVIDGRDATMMQGHTAMFGEDLHWWRSLNGTESYICSDFEPSAMAAVNITANGGTVYPSSFSSFTNSGASAVGSNGHETVNCWVTLYEDQAGGVQHNVGFWPSAAPREF